MRLPSPMRSTPTRSTVEAEASVPRSLAPRAAPWRLRVLPLIFGGQRVAAAVELSLLSKSQSILICCGRRRSGAPPPLSRLLGPSQPRLPPVIRENVGGFRVWSSMRLGGLRLRCTGYAIEQGCVKGDVWSAYDSHAETNVLAFPDNSLLLLVAASRKSPVDR